MSQEQLYTVYHNGVEYKTKFKVGDRVRPMHSINVVIIEGVNDMDTSILKKLCWNVVDEDFVLGKTKTTHADPVLDDEIRHV